MVPIFYILFYFEIRMGKVRDAAKWNKPSFSSASGDKSKSKSKSKSKKGNVRKQPNGTVTDHGAIIEGSDK
jgi:hypothetical protein